jgi:hypothetical protein
MWKEILVLTRAEACKIVEELLFLHRTNPIDPMSKTVLIAPANLVLQPKTIVLPTTSASPLRKTIVLVPQPARSKR